MSANLYRSCFVARAPRRDKLALQTAEGVAELRRALCPRGRAAQGLVELGVEPGDRVAAQIDKSPEAIVLALACFRAGAALLPLNTAYTLAELEYFLADAAPALTICRPGRARRRCARSAAKLGLKAVESLGRAREGTFAERIDAASDEAADRSRAPATISPRSSTPRAPPAARRARC